MKKLIFLVIFVACVIVGVWFFEGENGSLFGSDSNNAPLLHNKANKHVERSSLDNKPVPADVTVPVNPTVATSGQNSVAVVQNNLPAKPMITKVDANMLGNPPEVSFKDLYTSVTDPKIDADLKVINDNVNKFVSDYKGKIAKLKPEELLKAIQRYEALEESQYKISEMAFISRDLDVTNVDSVKLYAKMNQKNADFSSQTAFFTLELIKLTDAQLNKAYKDKKAAGLIKYQPFLNDVRKFSKYTLSEDLEKMSIQKNITANEAWSTLYTNILSTISLKVNGETFSLSQSYPLVTHKNADIRKAVTEEIGKALKINAMPITMSINSIMKDKRLEDNMRGYDTPISNRNLQNSVDDVVVNNLISVVKNNYAKTTQRYYKIKAKLLGMQTLNYSDRLAPMPFDEDSKIITWSDAKSIVVSSYEKFSPAMSLIAEKFFANNWIDAKMRENKVDGAYCDPGIPSNHPYILLTYDGTNRSILTIAHEIGHGIHSVLSYPNGMLMFTPGLNVAEMASLFGENLTYKSLINGSKNNKEKATLLARQIEANINAAITAVAIAEFENKIHAASKNGDLSTEDINNIWIGCLKDLYGDSINLGEYDAYRWASIGHIFRTPFYYYAYAFSQLMVNSLYNVYDKKTIQGFENKMVAALSAGGTKKYDELLAMFGLKGNDPAFWQNGIDLIIKMIDDFENLVNTDNDIQGIVSKNTASISGSSKIDSNGTSGSTAPTGTTNSGGSSPTPSTMLANTASTDVAASAVVDSKTQTVSKTPPIASASNKSQSDVVVLTASNATSDVATSGTTNAPSVASSSGTTVVQLPGGQTVPSNSVVKKADLSNVAPMAQQIKSGTPPPPPSPLNNNAVLVKLPK